MTSNQYFLWRAVSAISSKEIHRGEEAVCLSPGQGREPAPRKGPMREQWRWRCGYQGGGRTMLLWHPQYHLTSPAAANDSLEVESRNKKKQFMNLRRSTITATFASDLLYFWSI